MSENNFLNKALDNTVLNRRSFLKWSGALGGTAVLAGGLKIGLQPIATALSTPAASREEGEWISAACWHNCGGRCPNYVLVRDGVVVRQKTDDREGDTPDFPQQRGCARGRSQRHQVYGADRLKFPMKRKNWEPGGGKKELRGRDEWVRISWDEALDLVAGEIKRIKEQYGNRSIFSPGGSEIQRALTLYGGFVPSYGTTSGGTLHASKNAVLGYGAYTNVMISDRMEHRKVDLFVHWGANGVSSSGGSAVYHYLQNKKGGAKTIIIDPFYNETTQLLADEWIPIRPTTDHAMVLGMAYTLITEDDPITNPLIDWDFLNRCTVGFDADHMPDGVSPEENFRDYVLGTYDGVPKTPQWASPICGVPAERIRSLALEIARTKNVGLCMSSATCRVQNADSWPQMFFTFGAMTGHIGRSGSFTGDSYYHGNWGGMRTNPSIVKGGSAGVPGVGLNPIEEEEADVWTVLPKIPGTRLNDTQMWDAIVSGKYVAAKDDVRDIDIRLIYHGGGANLQTRDGMNKGIEAHRKVDFVVSHAQILTTNARYSDIVLPVTTPWEQEGYVISANREIGFIWSSQVSAPLYEAQPDIWIAAEIGKRLGLDPEVINPVPLKQQIFNQIAGAQIMKDDVPNSGGEYEPLVTITARDIARLGVEGAPQQGKITWQELKKKGFYQVPREPGDNYEVIAFKAFRDDPETNALKTATGKIQIHSQQLADVIESRGWTTIKPYPAYNPAQEGYEATFADWEKHEKGDYPLQLYTIHYLRRSHSVFDNIPQLRRAFPQEFFMNPLDAAERGIEHGDIVLITSRHGQVLRPVCVTPRMSPGVVTLPHGSWVEMDEESGIDKAGADNILNGGVSTGQGVSGWNSCNVQVEKYTGPIELKPDYQWVQRIPLKEANNG
ncbi:MAG: molybdopterin-dependent oxidoreductase [Anaerolineaceae bacterium]|nr:molybdopterin-dependent oxidoreductase [Anaerolineaceae bacterium]